MKLWGGRFEKKTDGLVDDFHSSITFDQRLYHQDIAGSIAHATMLGEQGIIPKADADAIVAGLKGIEADIAAGAPVNEDGSINLIAYVAWILKGNLNGD